MIKKDFKLDRIEYPTSLFGDLSTQDINIIHNLAKIEDLKKANDELFNILISPETKLYFLFRLFLKKINSNYNDSLTGITISYDKYYNMTEYNKEKNIYRTDKAKSNKSKMSKKMKSQLILDEDNHTYFINRSDTCFTKILYYEDYELTNNIAYEFSKRSKYPFAEIELFYLFKSILLDFLSSQYMADLSNESHQILFIQEAIEDYENFSDLLHFLSNEKTTIKTIYDNFECYFKTVKSFSSEEEYYLHAWQYYDLIPENRLSLQQIDILRTNFKSVTLPESEDFSFDLRLNMALPENDLIDYIKNVRKTLFKTEKMEDINIFETLFGERNDYRFVLADMLFTYDAIKIGMKYNHILDSINNYSEFGNLHNCTKDIRTLKRYFLYAKLLIEDDYYKALISPIHNNDIIVKIQEIKNSKKI